MTPTLSLLLTTWAVLPLLASATTYGIAKEYSGSTFFDGWDFFDHFDNLTNGNANFVSASEGSKDKLAFVNDAGNAIMKVDNTSTVALGSNRNTVRIATHDRFGIGSLWIVDMLHVPFGCATWPAFWSQAPGWPAGGEIDTFEGVNQVTQNTMSLHTDPGCTWTNSSVQSSTLVNTTDCNSAANENSGCGVTDPNTGSYGADFAAAGGGMWITEMASSGISVWFFNRASIPSSLQNNASTFDVATLGKPIANWPTSGCNIDQFFGSQNLIFDITLCGDFAGEDTVFAQTCPGICYDDWVVGPGSHFDDAYFEVASVRIFNNGTDTTVVVNGARTNTRPGFMAGVAGLVVMAAVMLAQSL